MNGVVAEQVIERIRTAFAATPRPGDAFLTSSTEGCEPGESVAPFRGKDWQSLDAALLDANYTSLSFFSEGAFRYFLPAYMIADVRDALRTADPAFHLTHGFAGFESSIDKGGRTFRRRHGGDSLLNPRRYGAISWRDHARFRLSVFCREESAAIVGYLRWRTTRYDDDREDIDKALNDFWLQRAAEAPLAVELQTHVAEEQAYMDAILRERGQRSAE